jgi:hypothetical protein
MIKKIILKPVLSSFLSGVIRNIKRLGTNMKRHPLRKV